MLCCAVGPWDNVGLLLELLQVHRQSCSTQWHHAHERLLQTDGLSGSQGVSFITFFVPTVGLKEVGSNPTGKLCC